MSGASITAEPLGTGAPPAGQGRDWRSYAIAAGFLAPTILFLGLWIVYPAVDTFKRSFYSRSGDEFVWFDNYEQIFTSDVLFTAVKNNAIWVLVVPALVTAIGLIFAVLTERVGWSVAFKTAVFMPMAISAFAAGVTWRIMYQQDPEQGAINAAIAGVKDAINPPGVLSDAAPSTDALVGDAEGGSSWPSPSTRVAWPHSGSPGSRATRCRRTSRLSSGALSGDQRRRLERLQAGWRHTRRGGGRGGRSPGVTVELRNADGGEVALDDDRGRRHVRFEDVGEGQFEVAVSAETFAEPFAGVAWLGPRLITPSIIIAYIWIWAGFSMVVIAAGLAAIPRDVLEAARTDGASEWQVFRA